MLVSGAQGLYMDWGHPCTPVHRLVLEQGPFGLHPAFTQPWCLLCPTASCCVASGEFADLSEPEPAMPGVGVSSVQKSEATVKAMVALKHVQSVKNSAPGGIFTIMGEAPLSRAGSGGHIHPALEPSPAICQLRPPEAGEQ